MTVVRIEKVGTLEFSQVKPFPVGNEFQQGLMNHGPFRLDPAQFLSFFDESRIELNVGSHDVAPLTVHSNVYSTGATSASMFKAPPGHALPLCTAGVSG